MAETWETRRDGDGLVEWGELLLRREHDDGTYSISLYGELDMATAPGLEEELSRAESTDAQSIILDLSGLDFIDSAGVAVVIRAATRASADSNRLALLRGSEGVDRLFALLGLHEHLPFAD